MVPRLYSSTSVVGTRLFAAAQRPSKRISHSSQRKDGDHVCERTLKGFVDRLLSGDLRASTLERRRMRHPTRGWGLRRALWVHGVDSPLAYMRLTADYSVVDRVAKIRCPTLICRAKNDDIGVSARQLYDALTCEKAFITFTANEGAGADCEAGARAVFNARAFDWLDALLDV